MSSCNGNCSSCSANCGERKKESLLEKLNWSPTETIDGDSGDADSG